MYLIAFTQNWNLKLPYAECLQYIFRIDQYSPMLRIVLHISAVQNARSMLFLSETIGNSVLNSCQNLVFQMNLKSATQMCLSKSNTVTQNDPQIYYCGIYMLRNDGKKNIAFSVVNSLYFSGRSIFYMWGKTLKLITRICLKSELKWFRQHLFALNVWVADSEQRERAAYAEPSCSEVVGCNTVEHFQEYLI